MSAAKEPNALADRDQTQPNPNPHPDCDNCGGTGWVEWTDKRKQVHGQPCYMCELLWQQRAANAEEV